MKINNSGAAYQLFQKYNAAAPVGNEQERQSLAARAMPQQKTDMVSLSGQATPRDAELGRLSQGIASELSTGVSASRIQSLKAAVENGEYYVPTSALADAILNLRG